MMKFSAAGTTAVYTANKFNDVLGSADKLAIMAVTDDVSGTSPTLAVQIEHSPDGRNWAVKNTSAAEIPATAIAAAAQTALTGGDSLAAPSLCFVRLKVTLGGTTPAAHIRIWICGRDA